MNHRPRPALPAMCRLVTQTRREESAAGLLTDSGRVDLILGRAGGGYATPNRKAMMRNSLKGSWCLCEFVPKRHWDWKKHKETHPMNLFRRRTIPPDALIHQSAYERGGYDGRFPDDTVAVT